MSYKIAIVDDEAEQIKKVREIVKTWAGGNGYMIEIREFSSAEQMLFAYVGEKDFDILLLDIEMRALSGIDLARQIRADNEAVQIIFITGYPDFISEGYDLAALHYLMKPIVSTKLCEVLDRAIKNLHKTEHTVILNADGESIRLAVEQIRYIEAFAHYVDIHTAVETTEIRSSITELELMFGEEFVRCHRSYLVNLRYIARITKSEVILDDGTAVPLSRRLYGAVHQRFIAYYRTNNGIGEIL